MNWPNDNLNTQCWKGVKNGATKIFLTQARDETDLQSELDSAKQEIAKLQGELIKAEAEKNKLRQQFNMPPMQKTLMQGKRARGEELDQEVSCFFLIIDIVTMFFCQLVNKKRKVVIPKVVRLTVR